MGTEIRDGRASLRDLVSAGLVEIGTGCRVSPLALFEPEDERGTLRVIRVGDGAVIEANAVLHGGTQIGAKARVESGATVGKPENGYAVGNIYDGTGAPTLIDAGAVVRAGAIVYAGAQIGALTVLGHHTLIRSFSTLGRHTLVGHSLVIERACRIGDWVRFSPLSHITSSTVVEDRAFVGAGVRTVNDKFLIWNDVTGREPELSPPYFERGCKVGSGSTIGAGVRIGAESIIGSASLVTRSIPAGVVAYGSPARVRRALSEGRS